MAQAYVYEDGPNAWIPLAYTSLNNSGVTAATYGDATHVGQFAVSAQGIITSASNVAITAPSTLIVTDGVHTVNPSGQVSFTSGATVTDAGGGVAQVAIVGTSPLTTKGDLFGHSTVDARIPVGTDGQVLTANSGAALGVSWGTGSSIAGGGLGVYGDGSDSGQTFDGTSVVLGITPDGNKNYTLTRDILLGNSTINAGAGIITNGFRIFCQGTLTNNGTIQWNGAAGGSGTQNFGGTATTNANSSISTCVALGGGGGTGVVGAGAQGATTTTQSYGGRGGTGGTGTGGAGGAGGALVSIPVKTMPLRFLPTAVIGIAWTGDASTATTMRVSGGTGGGAGGGDGAVVGGGGGAGGGVVIVAARSFAGTGAIQARGGNGSVNTSGNTGGGAGGGGGLVIVISGSVGGGAIAGQTIDANGGTKGSPHGTGTDNAQAGGGGTVILLPN